MKYGIFRKTVVFKRKFSLPLLFLFVFSLIPIFAFSANEERVSVIGGPFSLSGAWGGALNVGSDAGVRSVGVQHEAGTAEGSLVVIPRNTLTFSYAPYAPGAVLNGGIFGMDPLQGAWALSLANESNCSADPSVFLIGPDRYSFKLCGTRPAFSLVSSNATAVNCAGMVCTANGVGNARITATIAGTPTKIWGEKNTEGWQELVSTTLSSATLSWNVSVVAPPTLTFSSSGTNPIPSNTNVTLSWNAQNVISSNPCVASGDWSGVKNATGTFDTGNLQARRDYVLECTGPSGNTVERTVTVLVGSPMPGPVVTFAVGSTVVPVGTATLLSWDSPSADTCIAQGDWVNPPGPGPRPTNGSESTGPIFAGMTKTFILTCSNAGGSTPRVVSVSALPPISPPSFRSFSASPSSVAHNGSTTLSWDVRNATSCIASSDAAVPFANWDGTVDPVGSRMVSGITKTPTARFFLSCTGAGGTTPGSVEVLVAPVGLGPPTITLWADSNDIPYNSGTTIHWTTTQADSCAIGGSAVPTAKDDYTTGNLFATRTYTLTCQNILYSRSQSITIRVIESTSPVTLSLWADSYVVPYDGSTTVHWRSQNATTCFEENFDSGVLVWSGFSDFSGDELYANIREPKTVRFTCQNSSGPPENRTITILIDSNTIPASLPPPPPNITFQADSSSGRYSTLAYNTGTTLRWSVQYATSCVARSSPNLSSWTGSRDPVSGATFTGNLQEETVFYLDCSGPGGSSNEWVRIYIGNPFLLGPSLSFWADNFVVPSGGSTRLRWASSGATGNCRASGDWSGNRTLNDAGGTETGAITGSKTYRLTCSNAGGSVTAIVNVFVGNENPNASLSLWVDDMVVSTGSSTKIRWNAQNVRRDSCVASADPVAPGIWNGIVSFVGEQSTGPLVANQTYTLTCRDADGNVIEAKTRVGAGMSFGSGPEIHVTADAYDIPLGTAPVLNLQSSYVTACRTTGPGWLKNELLPSSNMTFDSSFVRAINVSTTYTIECTDASDPLSPTAVWGSANAPIRVVQVLLCPVSSQILMPGDTAQFKAWYTEDASVTCGTDESLRGIDVTTSADTVWQVVSGDSSLSLISPGRFSGISYGLATVRASHRPAAGIEYIPSQEMSVSVVRQINCHRCDDAVHACSSSVHYSMNDSDSCSTFSEFSSRTSCQFACLKSRWQEVAP